MVFPWFSYYFRVTLPAKMAGSSYELRTGATQVDPMTEMPQISLGFPTPRQGSKNPGKMSWNCRSDKMMIFAHGPPDRLSEEFSEECMLGMHPTIQAEPLGGWTCIPLCRYLQLTRSRNPFPQYRII